ncbi:MAG: hypothetical protein AW07_04707 [Candidatus Accumulibacter sp. SK-11]|nr:MAG: hypothetical protein AW07_04707 [Candidatus Accumulibacter sp. SK-11]
MLQRPVVRGMAEQLRADRHADGDEIRGRAVAGERGAAALAGEDEEEGCAAVGEPDVGGQRQAGAQPAAEQQVGGKAPAAGDGEEVAEQRVAAGGAAAAVAPEDQQAAAERDDDADAHQPARPLAEEQERGDADPQEVGRHQRRAARHRGVLERADPGGEVQREKEAGAGGEQGLPRAQRAQRAGRLPERERCDDECRETQAQRRDGERRQPLRLREARQDGTEGDRQQADGENQERQPAGRRGRLLRWLGRHGLLRDRRRAPPDSRAVRDRCRRG